MDQPKQDGSLLSIPIPIDLNAPKSDLHKNLDRTQECATAIGNVCFAWAALETLQDRLISSILGIKEKPLTDTLLSNIDQREKFELR
jgi:hypothetical protein